MPLRCNSSFPLVPLRLQSMSTKSYPKESGRLLLGFTSSRRPLHIHCSYPSRPIIKIITPYEPDPSKWIDFMVRRRDDACH